MRHERASSAAGCVRRLPRPPAALWGSSSPTPVGYWASLSTTSTSTVLASPPPTMRWAWANLPSSASSNWRAIRLSVVRGFASYLHGLDASVEVPSADLIRRGPDRATPYLYSDSEIRGLLAAAR